MHMVSPTSALDKDAITIGQVLQASAAGDKLVKQSDVAAIQALEMRAMAIRRKVITLEGIGAAAQLAVRTSSVEVEGEGNDVAYVEGFKGAVEEVG